MVGSERHDVALRDRLGRPPAFRRLPIRAIHGAGATQDGDGAAIDERGPLPARKVPNVSPDDAPAIGGDRVTQKPIERLVVSIEEVHSHLALAEGLR